MFSQNVFSARDVLTNSALNDSNTWDSQPCSQAMYSAQNSQMSSMEMFSQQKVPISSKFVQYQRSQSQTEDEPPNYYSKYVNNPPLFPASSKNIKLNSSMQTFIEEGKQNISMKEERDMLQTFINLLKDYTNEVDLSFKNFKDDMESTLKAVVENIQDGTQRIDDRVTSMKQQIVSIFEAERKELHQIHQLNETISEQSGKIKALQAKEEILEKQLNEMKNKETAFFEQKNKLHQREEKFLENANQWNPHQTSCIGNTPTLSQHIDSTLGGFTIPPINVVPANYNEESRYEQNPWHGRTRVQPNDYYPNEARNNPLPIHVMVKPKHHLNNNMAIPYSTNPPYFGTTVTQKNYQLPQRNQTPSTANKSILSINHSKVLDIGFPNPKSCGLNVSRRNSKRPKQSPMAMVKPQVRHISSLLDDDIFLCDVIVPSQSSKPGETPFILGKRKRAHVSPEFHTPSSEAFNAGNIGSKKSCRQEDTVKRKRSVVSMLGVSSDDSEVMLEITNALKAQSRDCSKRTKSLP